MSATRTVVAPLKQPRVPTEDARVPRCAERADREGRAFMTRAVGTPVARLEIRNGEFAGMTYELGKDETLIGRNPTTDITLLDEGISREHAVILADETTGGHVIEDLQSTNGTKVNGKRVRSAELQDGDEIQIGHTCFLYQAH